MYVKAPKKFISYKILPTVAYGKPMLLAYLDKQENLVIEEIIYDGQVTFRTDIGSQLWWARHELE